MVDLVLEKWVERGEIVTDMLSSLGPQVHVWSLPGVTFVTVCVEEREEK